MCYKVNSAVKYCHFGCHNDKQMLQGQIFYLEYCRFFTETVLELSFKPASAYALYQLSTNRG